MWAGLQQMTMTLPIFFSSLFNWVRGLLQSVVSFVQHALPIFKIKGYRYKGLIVKLGEGHATYLLFSRFLYLFPFLECIRQRWGLAGNIFQQH